MSTQNSVSPGSSQAAEKATSGKASETLSQFVARVLTQLSLSAWLPSAALVLSLTLVIQLGSVADLSKAPADSWSLLGQALGKMAQIDFGGALLLFVAVVVLTIFTQAFSYEAIRMLEGYWGAAGPVRTYAAWRCRRFESRAGKLRTKSQKLIEAAWADAEMAVQREQERARNAGESGNETLAWSGKMLTWLRDSANDRVPTVGLDKADRTAALQIPWQRFTKPEHLRLEVILDKKLRDYPRQGRCLPTRLGNVLRAHEDQTGRSPVEPFVLEIYDLLPLAMRIQHDEHRNRLDLYASMIFVEILVAVVAVLRLIGSHAELALAAAVVGVALSWLTYRGAIASARIYGVIIINIAKRFPV